MQFYWDRFLFQATFRANMGGVRAARARLDDVLGQTLDLIPQLSIIRDYVHDAYPSQSELYSVNDGSKNDFLWFSNVRPRGLGPRPKERDTALALLYVFAGLLKNMLKSTADSLENFTDNNLSAIALCRLCASFSSHPSNPLLVSMLVKRSLFWARIMLRKSEFPEGSAYNFALISSTYMDQE